MRLLYDPQQYGSKVPFGALTVGETCTVTVRETDGDVAQMWLVLHDEGDFTHEVSMHRTDDAYTAVFTVEKGGLYFYHFRAACENGVRECYRMGHGCAENGTEWEVTVCPAADDFWRDWAGKTMYQIFPDRFAKSGSCDLGDKLCPFTLHEDTRDTPSLSPDAYGNWNTDFYGGNLQGILEKLPYLKELGVDIIYLNPIFMAQSNHRYDTADYKRIDPMLGTEADFVALCDRAHALGMRVLLDGVFSHTGSNSVYFDANGVFGTGALSDPDSPYRSWYDFHADGTYDCWWGILTLPCVKETDPSYLAYLVEDEDSVVAHWLRLGADGFRLDVADELPDSFLVKLRQRVKQIRPDGMVLGEVWEDASNKISYGVRRQYFSARELDGVMNYPYRNAILDYISARATAAETADTILEIASHYPVHALNCCMVPLSTHDTPRALSLFGPELPSDMRKEEKAKQCLSGSAYMEAVQKLRTAAFLQFMLPGIPSIYYGDEAGLQGWEDPLNRRFFDWEHIDWFLHDYFASLSRVRRESEALRTGEIRLISDQGRRLVMERTGEEPVRFAINLDEDPMEIACRRILFCENCNTENGCLVYKFGAVCYRV